LGAKLYGLLCEYASLFGVTPLLKPMVRYPILKRCSPSSNPQAAKIAAFYWDIHHTVCFAGEEPKFTVEKARQLH
jgi:hypothetical protein